MSLMTKKELNERFDGSNGLELSIERYERMLEEWDEHSCRMLHSQMHSDTCGLCSQFYNDETSCPLYKMGEYCSYAFSLWRSMEFAIKTPMIYPRLEFRSKPRAYDCAEEMLRYLLQIKMYQDGEI